MTEESVNRIYIEGEVARVSDGNLKKFLLSSLDRFPDYFWIAPASNTKYHHEDERKSGGLVLHVRRLVKLVDDMVKLHSLNLWERDILIAACILHDSFSRGIPPRTLNYSDPLHPVYVEYMFPFNADADRYIDRKTYNEIMECVSSHQGPWTPNSMMRSNRKLPVIFQTIDYVGSREHIKVEL